MLLRTLYTLQPKNKQFSFRAYAIFDERQTDIENTDGCRAIPKDLQQRTRTREPCRQTAESNQQ